MANFHPTKIQNLLEHFKQCHSESILLYHYYTFLATGNLLLPTLFAHYQGLGGATKSILRHILPSQNQQTFIQEIFPELNVLIPHISPWQSFYWTPEDPLFEWDNQDKPNAKV